MFPSKNILMDWAQMDLDFGLIRQNISIKKAPLLRVPSSSKVWLNSYLYRIRITTNSFYSQQFSLPYSKNILLVWGEKKKKKKVLVNPSECFHQKISFFSPFPIHESINSYVTSCPLIQKGSNWIQWKDHF